MLALGSAEALLRMPRAAAAKEMHVLQPEDFPMIAAIYARRHTVDPRGPKGK